MGLVISVIIYLLGLTYIIVRHLITLFNSKISVIRNISIIAAGLFFAYQLWGLIPFIKNENGKSFTVGWFALLYFFAVSFSVFTIVTWFLRSIEKKYNDRTNQNGTEF
ncbi:hypothetical protein [Dyadobacter sediminis]|uniref:Uncharacterized protein n=1 Tax=Dyadobacter sediminis TaxID=1493691 RepID=A0A5R9KIN5_9BACT|nr:hypothetical protein [Dyadobacter sediminis]TLU96042.1 hypothetical protein FEM55_02525 [Dyadobacter sediminis]